MRELESYLSIARAQINRSMRVGRSAGLFWELARYKKIMPHPERSQTIAGHSISRTIGQLLLGERVLADPDKALKFIQRTDNIAQVYRSDISGVEDHLEQALSVLIENAAKYSLMGSEIAVSASRDEDGHFVLCVENLGYPINADEVKNLKQRGFRGSEATARVSSGRGIGLWLANEIMLSFGGKLEIEIGDGRGRPHRFNLVFLPRTAVS